MNPVERLAAAAHVGYELRQMAGAAIRIDNAPDEATHDSHLESTLLHARNLIEFLIGAQIGRGRTTDVRAQVFVPQWAMDDAAVSALGDRLGVIDKHLAHLTWARVSEGKQLWPYPGIVREIVEHMREYHKAMKASGVAFDNAVGDELDAIDREAPRVWESETVYGNVETTSSQTVAMFSRTEDPLELSDFLGEVGANGDVVEVEVDPFRPAPGSPRRGGGGCGPGSGGLSMTFPGRSRRNSSEANALRS
jgi:hypothetical protein